MPTGCAHMCGAWASPGSHLWPHGGWRRRKRQRTSPAKDGRRVGWPGGARPLPAPPSFWCFWAASPTQQTLGSREAEAGGLAEGGGQQGRVLPQAVWPQATLAPLWASWESALAFLTPGMGSAEWIPSQSGHLAWRERVWGGGTGRGGPLMPQFPFLQKDLTCRYLRLLGAPFYRG